MCSSDLAYYRAGGYNGHYGAAATRGAFDNHGEYGHGNEGSHGYYGQAGSHPFNGDTHAARGYEPHGQAAQPRESTGMRSGAFSGYDHGGATRSYSSRGASSFGGGGGYHGGGGGGGFHGGGGGGSHGGGGGGHH